MRLDEELEGDPKCNECLGRGLIVVVQGKAYHIEKCGCIKPVNAEKAADYDWAKHINRKFSNAGRS
jgi:hypothetical protein